MRSRSAFLDALRLVLLTLREAGSRATNTPDNESAKAQTHSAKTVVFGCLSPNGSALWPQQRPDRDLIATNRGELHYTSVRHADDMPPADFV